MNRNGCPYGSAIKWRCKDGYIRAVSDEAKAKQHGHQYKNEDVHLYVHAAASGVAEWSAQLAAVKTKLGSMLGIVSHKEHWEEEPAAVEPKETSCEPEYCSLEKEWDAIPKGAEKDIDRKMNMHLSPNAGELKV